MKRRMTLKKSLKITAERYRWLFNNPRALPADWPGWEDYGFDMSITSKDKNPLCQVAEGNCSNCPLIALWIKDSGDLPRKQRLKSCLVRTSPFMVRQRNRHSIKKVDKAAALDASLAIFTEAEYALANGVREPDLSIYEKARRRMRGREEAQHDEDFRRTKRKRLERARTRRVR